MDLARYDIDLVWTVYSLGFSYTALILPGLLYWALLRRSRGRNRALIALCVMIVIWGVLNVYRDRTFLIRMAYVESIDPGNTNDGQAGDFLLFLFGWVAPVFSMVCFDLMARVCGKLRFRSMNAARI